MQFFVVLFLFKQYISLTGVEKSHFLLQGYFYINPLTAGAAYIRVFIFMSTLSTTF